MSTPTPPYRSPHARPERRVTVTFDASPQSPLQDWIATVRDEPYRFVRMAALALLAARAQAPRLPLPWPTPSSAPGAETLAPSPAGTRWRRSRARPRPTALSAPPTLKPSPRPLHPGHRGNRSATPSDSVMPMKSCARNPCPSKSSSAAQASPSDPSGVLAARMRS